MARDYKDSPQTRSSGKPIVTGIIIGLLLGLLIAVGVVMFINRSASPYRVTPESGDKAKASDKKASDAIKPLQSDQGTATAGKAADKPRFDFYEILPGDKDAAKTAKENAVPPEKTIQPPEKTAMAAPSAKPAETAPIRKETVFLQAGAFQSVTDADNQKAKLALLGFEANVASAQVAGKGTLYRVRIGPYQSTAEANKAAGVLSQSGVATSLIKGDTPPN
jgi:cell division protein FtsN